MEKKKEKSKALTAEDLKLKSIHNRRKFKACVRLVIANLFWLEDMGDEALGEDVKKNVMLLLKKKKDKKGLLTIYEKTILCKPAKYRTAEEKLQLFKVIGNLKCFRKYPTDVKMKLAAACYFVYFPPGRVIVRQYAPGKSLYFIMQGEVSVSITIFDPILNEYNTTVVGTMEAGQMFGEVSLLHNIPRTATITTISHCEMIVLQKADFDKVLKSSLQVVWDQILDAIARFRYFDGWDEVSMRECCIYSRIATYRMGDIVFGSGDHSDNYVHYILKGACQCVEELPIVEFSEGGIIEYKLFDREAFNKEIRRRRRKRLPLIRTYTVHNVPVVGGRNEGYSRKQSFVRKTSIRAPVEQESEKKEPEDVHEEKEHAVADLKKLLGISQIEEKDEEIPPCVKKIFMQVCVFSELACFGLGENLKYRKIVACTDYLECLLIPKFWIWSKNKGNVWTTVVQTLNRKLPTTNSVFKTFVEDREWGKYKIQMVNQIRGKPPVNCINNVPYSIRLKNDLKFGARYK